MLTLACRIVFFPIWTFHAVIARGRFSLPAPSVPHNRHVCLNVSLPRWRKSKRLVIYLFLYNIFFNKFLIIYVHIDQIHGQVWWDLFFFDSGLLAMPLLQHHCSLHLNFSFVPILRVFMVCMKTLLLFLFYLRDWQSFFIVSLFLFFSNARISSRYNNLVKLFAFLIPWSCTQIMNSLHIGVPIE